jgi:hypothetical protein
MRQLATQMTNTPESLVLEHLRVIRTDVAIIKADLADVKAMQLRMREDFNRFERNLLLNLTEAE